ncbi:MAG: PA0069 family radical SAM protein [Cyclobacteriaceae bacterium]|nr:PA0069 family radical SAM protein [Cyclobacteriaceae bacterium]MDW8330843.1 PA0069 family radical SAM protein [Cyclobacteriaceae bacterium]
MLNEKHKPARGAQHNPLNRFRQQAFLKEHPEGVDEDTELKPQTQIFFENARAVVNEVTSPDLGIMHSVNPYQGCEHGCSYCYARTTHEYYGLSSGLDFESKIMVKQNAPVLLEKFLQRPSWKPAPIALSGNTDCYQPLERKLQITRRLLEVLWRYRNPVSIITKNRLIVRDLDLLQKMAQQNLVHVYLSVTTLDEDLRRVMEPRTATVRMRLQTIAELSAGGIPVGVMMAPVIPGLNDHEILKVAEAASANGARTMGYTVVRLNGTIGEVFSAWLKEHFPDRYDKVWKQIKTLHGGAVYDERFGRRLTGEGKWAEIIRQTVRTAQRKYFSGKTMPDYNYSAFRKNGMPTLFGEL